MTNTRYDGGPAFPAPYDGHGSGPAGMSLRDYTAIHLDMGIKAQDQDAVNELCDALGIAQMQVFDDYGQVNLKVALEFGARLRWAYADLMLRERDK